MQLYKVGDVSFVQGWTQPWYSAPAPGRPQPVDPLTKVPYPLKEKLVTEKYTNGRGELTITRPTEDFLAKQFPALDALIETPIAFALLAPKGWNGECAWYTPEHLQAYGWEAVAWKESTHKDKTLVQLFRRVLDRPEPGERPTFVTGKTFVMYSQKPVRQCGLPYLGCSSIFTAWDEPRTPKIDFDELLPQMYHDVDPKVCLHLLRVARPISVSALNQLRDEGYRRVGMTSYNQYWVRGKPGLGSPEKCEY